MVQSLTPHFSKKVLLLSMIFLLANLGIYALKALSQTSQNLQSQAPRLISASIEEVELKSAYDEDFRFASRGQELYSGTIVKTSELEFAELVLGSNVIKMDENTELLLLSNRSDAHYSYAQDMPRLVFELRSGSVWVNAFDLIEVRMPRASTRMHHSVSILTYSSPINRAMVVTGDMNLSLLSKDGPVLSEFVVPLHNQVTFVDSQITEVYQALKPSKLKKELKMAPVSDEILTDSWVARNANQFVQAQADFEGALIQSTLAYQIRHGLQKAMSTLTFTPEARRELAFKQAQTMLNYILGALQSQSGMTTAQELITQLEALLTAHKNDPQFKELVTGTLFATHGADFDSPAFALKESLINQIQQDEGTYVYRVYLSDLRHMLYDGNMQVAESILKKWRERWTDVLIQNDPAEFDRQSQILNHTLLSYIDKVPYSMLEVYDETGDRLMAYSDDPEETRFEVTQNRLQIAASLVSEYRYIVAKQYLKSSYLSLNIGSQSADKPFTKIFLENGRLLAQRIQYAEEVLHGAAQPIDETQFRDYFQAKTRDEGFTQDLRNFFEVEEEVMDSVAIEAPGVDEVATRFLDARINVNYTDITLLPGFQYAVVDARLMDRGLNNQSLSFDATYDYVSNSVTDVRAGGRGYQGSFTLSDLVTLLRRGDQLTQNVYAPSSDDTGLDLLLTDNEKLAAQQGQLLAQDVARKLAVSELAAVGVTVPNPKLHVEILDALNLDKFRITGASITRSDGGGEQLISFEYNSATDLATKVSSDSGVTLLEAVSAVALVAEVSVKAAAIEKQLEAINAFDVFAKQNSLYIFPDDITFMADGTLQLRDLEMLNLGIEISAVYDPKTGKFVLASHELLSSENIAIKEYFEKLASLYIIDFFSQKGIVVSAQQITAKYPFTVIRLSGVSVSQVQYSFELNLLTEKLSKVQELGSDPLSTEMSVSELVQLALSSLPAEAQEVDQEPEASE